MTHLVPTRTLSDPAVLTLVQAALAAAAERSTPVTVGVAVVDTSGLLRSYVLMSGAPPMVEQAAVKKARTAAYLGRPSGTLDPAVASALTAATNDFTMLRGGIPIVVDGVTVGGIGVGGASPDEDAAIAQAGIDALIVTK